LADGTKKLLGDPFSEEVVAAMWQRSTDIFQNNFEIRRRSVA
jgi:hypothetical protein